jgi:UDP-N-acetyl-D-glucosamine dehydrogenase
MSVAPADFDTAECRRALEVESLAARIRSRSTKVGIVGLGYIRLPLAIEFAKAGFSVTGIDVQQSKVDLVNARTFYIQDVPTEVLSALVKVRRPPAHTDFAVMGNLDTIDICVPTPLRKIKGPDMS